MRRSTSTPARWSPSRHRKLYASHRWRVASENFRNSSEGALCRPCQERGLVVPSEAVDHIVEHNGDETLFWAPDNWQGICHDCHSAKSSARAHERAGRKPGRKRMGCDINGMPLPGSGHWWLDDK